MKRSGMFHPAARLEGGVAVIWVAVVVSVLLFVYLMAALLRPEKF